MKHQQLFNKNSELYAKARPQYPQALFTHLASLCTAHEAVWDVACGNGQASLSLATHFDHVYATDISEQQIAHAAAHPKIHYAVHAAENTNFPTNQFDLVTVAQALHWFDFNQFWPEVRRVLKPNGIFAAWGYSWLSIDHAIDTQLKENFQDVLKPYWAPQNRLLWNRYRDVPFPFEQLPAPAIEMKTDMNLEQLFAYLRSWSATRLCMEQNGEQFLLDAYDAVAKVWGDKKLTKQVNMNFCMLIGRNSS